MIVDILKQYNKIIYNIDDIINDLINIYKKLTNDFRNEDIVKKILEILFEESQVYAKQIQNKSISLIEMFNQPDFEPIFFDLWLLFDYLFNCALYKK